MCSLLRPIVVNALRAALTIVALGRTMALVAIGLAVALTIQLYPTATGDLGELTPTAKAVVGWGVLAALLVSAALAPSAVRLPRRPADVTWLYTAPLPLWQIALAAGAWHAAVRAGGGSGWWQGWLSTSRAWFVRACWPVGPGARSSVCPRSPR